VGWWRYGIFSSSKSFIILKDHLDQFLINRNIYMVFCFY
jgi:hypothetical protein